MFTQLAIESATRHCKPFIAFALFFFFAFTTILAYYYIAETNIAYSTSRTIKIPGMMFVLKLVLITAVFYGTVKQRTCGAGNG
ncbi:alanine:cation symporter family protein [Vibrio lentus]|nr:alanine:cation symporter family protein [Vibrio lentus]